MSKDESLPIEGGTVKHFTCKVLLPLPFMTRLCGKCYPVPNTLAYYDIVVRGFVHSNEIRGVTLTSSYAYAKFYELFSVKNVGSDANLLFFKKI